MIRPIACILAALCCIFGLSSDLAAETPDPATLKIGVSAHLSGEWAREGGAMLEGALLAAEELNAKGGAGERPIKIIPEDNQSKPGPSVAAAKKLIQIDKVAAALISSMTETNFCGLEFERQRVPLVVLWDSSPEIENLGEYIFSIGPWAPDAGERLARFARKNLKAENAVVMHSNSRWSMSVARYFASNFSALGGTIQETFSIDPLEADYRSFLLKARALKPSVFYAPIEYNIAAFITQLAQLKLDTPVLMSDLITADVLAGVGGAAEGIYHSQPNELNAPLTAHLRELYQTKHGRQPELLQFNAWGYDGVRLIAEAARRSRPERESIKRTLYQIKNYPGASSTLTISAAGSSPTFEGIYQVRRGKFVLVEP
jgi:branched-chain amino acid transport system substrate-binding protein